MGSPRFGTGVGSRRLLRGTCAVVALALGFVFGSVAPVSAYIRPGITLSVSVPDAGTNHDDVLPTNHIASDISGDGRFVVFGTDRKGLEPRRESPTHQNLFVRDMRSGDLALVTVTPEGLPLAYAPRPLGYGSGGASLSHDGRYVGFFSDALNLVRGDTNIAYDVFVRDMAGGGVVRASVSSQGEEANGPSTSSSVSGNGRFVVFQSQASNLVPSDTNGASDVFVRDLEKNTTTRISMSSRGEQGNGFSGGGGISSNGRFAVFNSSASNLVPGDENETIDVFVHDRRTGKTERVSVSTLGEEGDDVSSGWMSVSDDGRYVAFRSNATNLVPAPDSGLGINKFHIYVRDRQRHRTERVDVSSSGVGMDARTQDETISADGRFIVFDTNANLATNDKGRAGDAVGAANGEGDRDVYIHDMATGATEFVAVNDSGQEGRCAKPISLLPIDPPPLPDPVEDLLELLELEAYDATSSTPSISATGRYVSFRSCATNLVGNDKDVFHDIYRRDRGEVLSVGGFLRVPGSAGSQRMVPADPQLGAVAATVQGEAARTAEVNIEQAKITYRLSLADLVLRLDVDRLARLAGTDRLDPTMTYGFEFTIDGTSYEARASAGGQTTDDNLLVSACDGIICRTLRRVSGGVGNIDESVIITVPSAEVGLGRGSIVSGVSAFIVRGAEDVGGGALRVDQLDLFR